MEDFLKLYNQWSMSKKKDELGKKTLNEGLKILDNNKVDNNCKELILTKLIYIDSKNTELYYRMGMLSRGISIEREILWYKMGYNINPNHFNNFFALCKSLIINKNYQLIVELNVDSIFDRYTHEIELLYYYVESMLAVNNIKNCLKYALLVNDYFIKCHIKKADGSTLKFFGQVGNPKIDHAYWGSAEAMNILRPSYYVDDSRPGTELTAETAAALAAASMVFEKTDSSYSAKLLAEAITLYAFADLHRGSYTNSIVAAKGYYDSFNGYQDELMWGAIWLYKATREKKYLEKAKGIYTSLPNQLNQNVKQYIGGDSWDNKVYASYVLMAELSGEASYRQDAARFLDYWSQGHEGNRIAYSPGGQAFFSKWGSLRYTANASFLAFMYVKYFQDVDQKHSATYKAFGISQVNYILGDNPRRSSYVIGFGNNSPTNPHHRNAHGSISGNIKEPVDTKHILFGALVGGPSKPNDDYHDVRNNYVENEVSCDYNAGFTGAMAMMVGFFGGKSLDGFPPL
jgi:hypothetical protein